MCVRTHVRTCKYCTTHPEVGQNDSREEVLPVGEEEALSTHSQHNSDQRHVLLGGTVGVDCVRVRETEEWRRGRTDDERKKWRWEYNLQFVSHGSVHIYMLFTTITYLHT